MRERTGEERRKRGKNQENPRDMEGSPPSPEAEAEGGSSAALQVSRGSGPTSLPSPSPPLPPPTSGVICHNLMSYRPVSPAQSQLPAFSSPSPPPNQTHKPFPRSWARLARPITLGHHAPSITYITGVGYRTLLCVWRRVRACLLASSCVVRVCVCVWCSSSSFPSLPFACFIDCAFFHLSSHLYTHMCTSLPPSIRFSFVLVIFEVLVKTTQESPSLFVL